MGNDKNKKVISNLSKKASAIFGLAIAALTGTQAKAVELPIIDLEPTEIQISNDRKVKPMPVLKLNPNNLDDSQFVANHSSHRSHSSHSSHSSHRSHSSHYSSSYA